MERLHSRARVFLLAKLAVILLAAACLGFGLLGRPQRVSLEACRTLLPAAPTDAAAAAGAAAAAPARAAQGAALTSQPEPSGWQRGSAWGSHWQSPLASRWLDPGIISEGDPAARQRLAQKLAAGQDIMAVALGGSLTYGRGASSIGRTDWVARLADWLHRAFPSANHTLVNRALAASPSEYMSFCVHHHLPPGRAPDLIIVEYNINDGVRPWHHAHPRSYERLLRHLLALPGRPLVVGLMLHSFHKHQSGGTFYQSGEAERGTLLQFYRLPWLSMRSVLYHPMQQGVEGFKPDQILQGDRIHPTDRGHEYIAQLVARYLQRILLAEQQQRGAAAEAAGGAAEAAAAEAAGGGGGTGGDATAGGADGALPAPMLPGALPLMAEVCLHSHSFQQAVVEGSMDGFSWEDKGPPGRPEIRAVTTKPASQLTIRIDTEVTPQDAAASQVNSTHTAVFLWYTHSHHLVGRGKASCSGGCTCKPQELKTAIKTLFGTQDHLFPLVVSRSRDCHITIRTMHGTDTGQHMFRVRGLVVSSAAAGAIPQEFLWGEDLEDMPPQPPHKFDDW